MPPHRFGTGRFDQWSVLPHAAVVTKVYTSLGACNCAGTKRLPAFGYTIDEDDDTDSDFWLCHE